MGRIFALHGTDPGSIPTSPVQGQKSFLRAASRVLLRVTPNKQRKFNKTKRKHFFTSTTCSYFGSSFYLNSFWVWWQKSKVQRLSFQHCSTLCIASIAFLLYLRTPTRILIPENHHQQLYSFFFVWEGSGSQSWTWTLELGIRFSSNTVHRELLSGRNGSQVGCMPDLCLLLSLVSPAGNIDPRKTDSRHLGFSFICESILEISEDNMQNNSITSWNNNRMGYVEIYREYK